MPSTSGRSNQERRAQSTELVLASALKLFVSRGYRATSIDNIAREAGLTKGAIYFYFKGKSALLLSLIAESSALHQAAFTRMQESRLNASAQLELFIDWAAEVGALNNELLLLPILMSMESSIDDKEVESSLAQLYDVFHAEMERVVCQGREEGVFVQDLFPREQAAVLVAFTDGMLLEWFRRSNQLTGGHLIQSAKTLLLSGLSRR